MTEDASYDPRFFAKIAVTEEEHFWFYTRTRIIATAVKQVVARFRNRTSDITAFWRVWHQGLCLTEVLHVRHISGNGFYTRRCMTF
jgi:hypothetical protein